MMHGVFSIDTHGEGWDLMPVIVEAVELGNRAFGQLIVQNPQVDWEEVVRKEK